MHTIKTLEIRADAKAVTVSSTVTGLGGAAELCEGSVTRAGSENTGFEEGSVEEVEVAEIEDVDETERARVDVAKDEDNTGCIKVVPVIRDDIENELGAKLVLVEVASKEWLLTT